MGPRRDRRRPREGHGRQHRHPGGRAGKLIWGDATLHEQLAYCVPLGIPHSAFLAWDTLDQDKAIAWQREQRKVCGGCGTRKEEWAADKFAYVGHIEVCPGCEALEQEKAHIQDAEEHGQRGLKAYLVPRELAEQVEAEGGYDAAAIGG